jgi:replicative DNA helicase
MKKQFKQAVLTNIEVEQIILGKILSDEHIFWDLNTVIQPFHFSRKIHQEIYSALHAIAHEGKKIGLTLLQSRVGPEYEDGSSTIVLMTALIRGVQDIDDINKEVRLLIEMWQRRRTVEICQMFMKEAQSAEADASYLLHDFENSVKDITANSQAEPVKTLGEYAETVMVRSSKAQQTGVSRGFDTGLSSLDEILGRIHPTDFGVIGAPRGHAKTILGMQIARRIGEGYRLPCAFFELEMAGEDLGSRALAGATNLSVSEIEEGTYEMFALEELRAAKDALRESRVFIDDRPKLRVDQILERCYQLKQKHGLKAAVVDHLRLIRANGRFKDKFDRIEHISGELKAGAKELDVAFIALSQVTRMSQRRDDPFPRIDDFDGGPSVEQDADWALGMFRWDAWLKERKPREMDGEEGREWLEQYGKRKGKIEIGVLKRRRGDVGERREFAFDGRASAIREIER